MQKDLIKNKVDETFKMFPDVDVLYATSDGNVFINKNYAELHANNNKGMNIETFVRPKEKEVVNIKPKSAEQLIKEITEVTSLEDLQNYVPGETRKTVLKAIEDRTNQLIASDDTTGSEDENASDTEENKNAENSNTQE